MKPHTTTKRLIPAILLTTAAAAPAGLVAYYPFDGNADDATSGGNHLTGYATNGVDLPELVPAGGRKGGFARFDGGNLFNTTYVPVTGNADRSLDMFIKIRADNAANNLASSIFFAGWGIPDLGTRVRFDFGFNNNTNSQLRNEYNAGATTSSNTTALNGGMWHHIAVVYTEANQTATFYLNGQPYGSAVANGALATGDAVGLTIGGDTRAGGGLTGVSTQIPFRFFPGGIDEVRVHDHAVSQAEIQTYLDDLRDNGPQVIFFEPDSTLSPPGGVRELRFQLSAAVTAASVDQAVGDVLPVDDFGYGSVSVAPIETTDWAIETLRAGQPAVASTSIEVSNQMQIRHFNYAAGRARMFVFLPNPVKDYFLVVSDSLDFSVPEVVESLLTPLDGPPYREVRDSLAPPGKGFYRLEEEEPPF